MKNNAFERLKRRTRMRKIRKTIERIIWILLIVGLFMICMTSIDSRKHTVIDIYRCDENIHIEGSSMKVEISENQKRIENSDVVIVRKNSKEYILKKLKDLKTAYGLTIPYKYLVNWVETESRFDSNGISKKGCKGICQIHPETFKELGFKEEDIFDVDKNLEAGVKYLRRIEKIFQKKGYKRAELWKLVFASYNCGPNKILRRAKKYHKWNKIVHHIPYETRYYVRKIMK